ncbi:hypothetical protein FA15DRAFT_661344 [Coprinopsis marcescibilis]|uniref:JmjC domain-containing protein n=1 Tax=Coprinopsis marcescibilis TaxID=230819 RepID=A0A5C3KC43_COPMA|nr:hypothetical protein FA15DRAFT_661344 [Coprinopsis marcescibilis]
MKGYCVLLMGIGMAGPSVTSSSQLLAPIQNGWVLDLLKRWDTQLSLGPKFQSATGVKILQVLLGKEGVVQIIPEVQEASQCLTFFEVEREGLKQSFRTLYLDLVETEQPLEFWDMLLNMKMSDSELWVVDFLMQRDMFLQRECVSDMNFLLGCIDLYGTKRGLLVCGYQLPFQEDDRTTTTRWSTTWTLPGSISHPHMDGYGDQAVIVHTFSVKLWLVWPPTLKNFKAMTRHQFKVTSVEMTLHLIDQLEGIEVLVLEGEKEVGFYHRPNMIHACLSFTESRHFGFYCHSVSQFEQSAVVLDMAVKWLKELDSRTTCHTEVEEEGDRMLGTIEKWKLVANKAKEKKEGSKGKGQGKGKGKGRVEKGRSVDIEDRILNKSSEWEAVMVGVKNYIATTFSK